MSTTSYEEFHELDDEIKQEFYEDVEAAVKEINECAKVLEQGADADLIVRMFRSLHTIKGNCNMVFLDGFVDVSHKLEDLFSQIRNGSIHYDDRYGRFAVSSINLIDEQMKFLLNEEMVDEESLEKLAEIVAQIQAADDQTKLIVTEKAITAIDHRHFNLDLVTIDHEHGRSFSFIDATDDEFFQFLVDKQAVVDSSCDKFINICETLTLKLNNMLGHSVEESQLKTAVKFIALSRYFSVDEEAVELSIEQVFFTSGLLTRMPGWNIAANITLQLKEHHDGTGAPFGVQSDQIEPAAQALALAVEFTLIILNKLGSGYKDSLFSAVKMINGKKDTVYKARLIERFNKVIKADYLNVCRW
jgi:HPt (histidine-containing phosphotransfer) domain-containing protein